MVEKRISETPTSETEKPSYLELKTETFLPPSTETPTGVAEVAEAPEKVEIFIEPRMKGNI
jgi:hypothetical protein